jgi:hypothetical protein
MNSITPKSLEIYPASLGAVREFIETNHYSHNVNGVRVTQCFSVQHESRLVGAVLYGAMSTTAWKKFGNSELSVLELRRLVLLDEVGRNSESHVVGWTLRWLKKNLKHVKTVVSYADPSHGHSGVIYRASNFKYVGLSGKDKGYRSPDNGKVYHSRALRVKYKGEFKPYVKRLRELFAAGKLEVIDLPRKHCFIYSLSH